MNLPEVNPGEHIFLQPCGSYARNVSILVKRIIETVGIFLKTFRNGREFPEKSNVHEDYPFVFVKCTKYLKPRKIRHPENVQF